MDSADSIRGFLIILSLLLATAVAPAQKASSPEDQEPIRVDVNLVSLRFTVKDSSGRFIHSLTPGDFEIRENGRPQEVAYFEAPAAREKIPGETWVAFLLDVSGSTFAARGEEVLAARSFFENVYDFTRVGIFGFTDALLHFQDFTSDRNLALAAFGAAHSHLGKTAIYDAVRGVISLFKQRAPSGIRKVIILISDGMDENYRLSAQAVSLARTEGVVIYTVWVPSATQLYIGPSTSGPPDRGVLAERKKKEAAFERLSTSTGGRHFGGFETILNFDDVLAEINDEIFGNLYSLGYYTKDSFLDRSQRHIEVIVRKPNVSVQGLFKNIPDLVQAKKQLITALFENSALGDLPSEMMVLHEIGCDLDILRPRYEGTTATVPFRIKISPFSLRRNDSGDIETQFGVIGLLADLNGTEVLRVREIFRAKLTARDLKDGRSVIYTNRLPVQPGRYLLRLAVVEVATWRMTLLQRPVQVRAPK